MRYALTEMRRRPQRFVTAAIILTLISVLLLFLGGLLDGLVAGQTNALAAQRADLLVFSSSAQDTLARSRLTGAERSAVSSAAGVREVGGLSVTQLGARRPGRDPRDLLDVAVFGYDLAPAGVPDPPGDGRVWADSLLDAKGVAAGDTLLVGPARTPLVVEGFVSGTSYSGQASLWASPATWRSVTAANRPDVAVGDDVVQALVVRGPATAADVDAATGGTTRTLTVPGAVDAVPGVAQLLKAMGARRSALVGGVVAQALVVSLAASAVGTALAVGLSVALPSGSLPFQLSAGRVAASVALVVVASVLGCLTSLRRVLRIDPASAIGSSS
jgi:putative ABC transport system permease protein